MIEIGTCTPMKGGTEVQMVTERMSVETDTSQGGIVGRMTVAAAETGAVTARVKVQADEMTTPDAGTTLQIVADTTTAEIIVGIEAGKGITERMGYRENSRDRYSSRGNGRERSRDRRDRSHSRGRGKDSMGNSNDVRCYKCGQQGHIATYCKGF